MLGDHENTARSYHELGVVQRGMGDLKGALESLQKASDTASSSGASFFAWQRPARNASDW